MSIGIEKLRCYPGRLSLDIRALVEARGGRVEELCGQMMLTARTVSPPWEDVVTMGVEAGLRVLGPDDRARVRLLLVASESGLDYEKAIATWLHRYLRLPDEVRLAELKVACYAGTSALELAAGWLSQWPEEDAAALVVTTDQSRNHHGEVPEFIMGGGATAMLVSRRPRFLALEPGLSGVHSQELSDIFRPTSRVETGHSETSLLSYLEGLDQAFERYRVAVERRCGVTLDSPAALDRWMPHLVYHAPFGGITLRAHRALLRAVGEPDPAAASADFATRVEPTLQFGRRIGSTYAGSVFISLLGLAASGRARPGDRVGIYSYGSGSCAEFYSGVLGEGVVDEARAAGLEDLLASRQPLSVAEYDAAEHERTAWIDCADYRVRTDILGGLYEERVRGRKQLVFAGATDWVRQYEWS